MRKIQFVAAACLSLAACSAGPEDTARGFMEDKAAGRTAEAMQRMDPAMAQTVGPIIAAVLATEAAKGKSHGGLKNVSVAEIVKADADHAIVRAEGHYGDGTVAREQTKLRRVDGTWYVTM
ncbi:DUF4878 domain-containing protein [Sphingomonas sp. CFBP 8760]|uniref:DUF4878 domain-containing protein n=1 Tax=Sphingomonas sp. CFBP 8760 TaxID=2775282 RepID=UPI0017839CEF|nr:DUF4878 domain-containing protein [Sphingomonas sp. CFBP 8760]MBD8546728.1 DUF4878 domain-containing protein [Sphingomonas sp. CFBP 8760]